ncbi:MAG: AtpZ/AtpI family protein [Candidatus Omnitrophota bacterium]|nr:AtpZ/AtpI family protein [Candidatus Omnitrophota bacterium]
MDQADKRKSDLYKWIKIGGLLSFLPFVLVSGPMAGYFLGNYLEKKFNLPFYVSIALITIGFAASIKETIKIVKMALRTQEKA